MEDIGGLDAPKPPNAPKNFCQPWSENVKPITIRASERSWDSQGASTDIFRAMGTYVITADEIADGASEFTMSRPPAYPGELSASQDSRPAYQHPESGGLRSGGSA